MSDREAQSLEIMKALAQMCADGKSLTIASDWGYGSGTLEQDGGHTHFGLDTGENEHEQLGWFIDGLHGQLVRGAGLNWVKP